VKASSRSGVRSEIEQSPLDSTTPSEPSRATSARGLPYATNTFADIENLAGTWTSWYSLTVSGPGTVTARFAATTHSVTFIDFPFNAHLSVTISGGGEARTVAACGTANLPSGVYTLTLSGGSIHGLRWFANSNLTFAPARGTTTTLTVTGSGTIYAVGDPAHAAPTPSGVTHTRVASGAISSEPLPFAGRWS
jgi:hypothetical protein